MKVVKVKQQLAQRHKNQKVGVHDPTKQSIRKYPPTPRIQSRWSGEKTVAGLLDSNSSPLSRLMLPYHQDKISQGLRSGSTLWQKFIL